MGPILHPHLPYTLERHYSAGIDTLLNPYFPHHLYSKRKKAFNMLVKRLFSVISSFGSRALQ